MKKKNDHTNLILSASAGMLIISICTFIFIYNDIFPDTKKFKADVWGTVSDWIIITITIVTAVYLYRTLQSQMEVQKMQQKLTDIEDFKFKNELLPYFEVKGTPPSYKSTEIHTNYFILNTGKPAHNIVVTTEGKASGGEPIARKWRKNFVNNGQKIEIFQNLNRLSNDEHFEIRITMIFEDQAGNKYMQYAEIIKPSKNVESLGERMPPSPIYKDQN